MCDTFFLHVNSKNKVNSTDAPTNFHIELPSRLHTGRNQDNSSLCFQIVHINFQGLWFLDSQHLIIKKTLLSPELPSLDTELTLEGGNYTLETLISSINLLATDLFKIQKYVDSKTGKEHIQLANQLLKKPGIYSAVLEMSFSLASILGFVLPTIEHNTSPSPTIGFLLFGCENDNAVSAELAAPSAATAARHCLLDKINIPFFEPFTNTQGQEITFQGDYSPSVHNNISQLVVDISSDYLVASPIVLKNPNYGTASNHHTLAYFHPDWSSLLKPATPATITLFPTFHQSVWLKFQSKLLKITVKDISGNIVPISPSGQTQLIIKVTKQSPPDKRLCA